MESTKISRTQPFLAVLALLAVIVLFLLALGSRYTVSSSGDSNGNVAFIVDSWSGNIRFCWYKGCKTLEGIAEDERKKSSSTTASEPGKKEQYEIFEIYPPRKEMPEGK